MTLDKTEEKKMDEKTLHGLTEGTAFETMTVNTALGEAKGAMMYYALARLARERKLDYAAEKFIAAADQEANHAGFYAVLAGMYPRDFWQLVRGLAKAESAGEEKLKKLAERFRAENWNDAADELERFAAEEGHHGELLRDVLDKYGQNTAVPAGQKVYVCGVCGYEYVGDLGAEAEDFVCPVCGQPKKVFRAKVV